VARKNVVRREGAASSVGKQQQKNAQDLQGSLVNLVTIITERILRACGFGPEGFTGSFETLVRVDPAFRKLRELQKIGIDFSDVGEGGREMFLSFADWLMSHGEIPPEELRVHMRRKSISKGGGRRHDTTRNIALAIAVGRACAWTGLLYSRNDSPSSSSVAMSGSAIVQEALHNTGYVWGPKKAALSAKRIAAIYRREIRNGTLSKLLEEASILPLWLQVIG
jgi:hypothetical protein